MRGTALTALQGWAARRDRMADDRADLMAAAWWSGTRTVAELARAADVSRDTVYDDLRARGIEPTTDKDAAPPDSLPPYAPLDTAALRALARQANTAVRPSMLTERPDWLSSAAWQISIALDRLGILADSSSGIDTDRRAAYAQDLAARLGRAQRFVHQAWGELASSQALGVWSRDRIDDAMEQGELVVSRAEVTLVDPGTGGVFGTVQLGTAHTGPHPGYTVLHADKPLLDPDFSGPDHLDIQTALQTLGRILNCRRDPGLGTFVDGEVAVDTYQLTRQGENR
ncbi:hypothetical protein [Streptomyces sp. NPDC059272]|uniref:hypothetical protein n=1 Tax=Streptomyces sp. NPDC059272 TaxID=3346800 RepID=UPI00369CCCED